VLKYFNFFGVIILGVNIMPKTPKILRTTMVVRNANKPSL